MKQLFRKGLIVISLIALIVTSYTSVSSVTTAKTKVGTVKINQWRKTDDSAWHQGENVGDGVEYTIKWKKVKGADGYQVNLYEAGYAGDGWYKIVNDQKKCSASLSFSSCYAIKAKVRAYKVKNGKKIYGQWSKIVKKVINY